MSAVVEVEVAGRTYRLQSDEGGSDLEAVARLVNERMGEIERAAPQLEREQAAILTALNVGDELLRQRAARNTELGEVTAAVEAVRGRLVELQTAVEGAPGRRGPASED